MQTFIDLMIIAAKFLVGIWPIMFITVLVGIGKRQDGFGVAIRSAIKGLIISWGLFAIMRVVFWIMKMETFHLIAEPLDTKLFLAVGLILFPFEVALLLEEKHNRLNASTMEELRSLSPSEFEELVAETYRAQGHHVDVVGGTGDHGIDLVVRSHRGETWLVQCKRYRGKVGEPIVRDFYGALRASDADEGAIITTGTISDAARLWAEGKPIKLYDGEQFLKIVIATRVRKSLPVEAKSRPKNIQPAPVAVAAVSRNPAPRMQPAYATVNASMPAPLPAAVTSRTPAARVQPSARIAVTANPPAIIRSSVKSESVVTGTTASTEENEDKHPFMTLNEAPMCPACNVPMILSTEKRFLRKSKQTYICPNAPDCPETYEVEE